MLQALLMRFRVKIPTLAALALFVVFGGAERGEAGEAKATVLKSVEIGSDRTMLQADNEIDRFRFFRLDDPSRLVVDIYGVRPGFDERAFAGRGGFDRMRVGVYDDRTRFVFDAPERAIASAQVQRQGAALAVSFPESRAETAAPRVRPEPPAAQSAPPVAEVPRISVKDVSFRIEGGKSLLSIELSGPARIVEPISRGNVVRFAVVNASIDRSLRRVIDTSAFPSAILRITPYTALEHGQQEVRFAAELKGEVPFALRRDGNTLVFEVDNLHFAEAAPPAVERHRIPVLNPEQESAAVAARPAVAPPAPAPAAQSQPSVIRAPAPEAAAVRVDYRGEKISLVFDNADIRSILQLIGEVSQLNIIASEAVRGTVTLRLVDVPWDQALDLVLDTNGLGMLRDGNVVRVLPRGEIRAMRQAELTAVRDERQLEPLTTEVIPVSYADLGAIVAPVRELLSDRGKVTPDARNKQVIVTDVAYVVEEVKRLVRILDTPERQVMIEARIVEANSTFSRNLGVNWGLDHTPGSGDISRISVGMGGSFTIPPPAPGGIGPAGLGSGITFGTVNSDSTILHMRISALENAGHGKVVSTPRVTTLNGGRAIISQGTKIPYQTISDMGTQTQFENAELLLEVSPVINPDNSVILDIRASNSSVGATVPTGLGATAIAIDERRAETKVLVRDGETTVIGGIFVESERESEVGVPLLMSIPILGNFFKSTTKESERRELLVFITPRILN